MCLDRLKRTVPYPVGWVVSLDNHQEVSPILVSSLKTSHSWTLLEISWNHGWKETDNSTNYWICSFWEPKWGHSWWWRQITISDHPSFWCIPMITLHILSYWTWLSHISAMVFHGFMVPWFNVLRHINHQNHSWQAHHQLRYRATRVGAGRRDENRWCLPFRNGGMYGNLSAANT